MDANSRANEYRQNKDIDDLTTDELITLGRIMADRMVIWATNKNYEPWKFDSEELPYLIDQAKQVGLIRDRKGHVVKSQRIVYDED